MPGDLAPCLGYQVALKAARSQDPFPWRSTAGWGKSLMQLPETAVMAAARTRSVSQPLLPAQAAVPPCPLGEQGHPTSPLGEAGFGVSRPGSAPTSQLCGGGQDLNLTEPQVLL